MLARQTMTNGRKTQAAESKYAAAVLAHLFAHVEMDKAVDTARFQPPGGSLHATACGRLRIPQLRNLQLVFTLGVTSPRVYMNLTNVDPREIARVLANLEERDLRTGKPPPQYSILGFRDAYLMEYSRGGALLMEPERFRGFERLEHVAEIQNRVVSFSMVVFITREELEYGQIQGIRALLEHFNEQDRDLISL